MVQNFKNLKLHIKSFYQNNKHHHYTKLSNVHFSKGIPDLFRLINLVFFFSLRLIFNTLGLGKDLTENLKIWYLMFFPLFKQSFTSHTNHTHPEFCKQHSTLGLDLSSSVPSSGCPGLWLHTVQVPRVS